MSSEEQLISSTTKESVIILKEPSDEDIDQDSKNGLPQLPTSKTAKFSSSNSLSTSAEVSTNSLNGQDYHENGDEDEESKIAYERRRLAGPHTPLPDTFFKSGRGNRNSNMNKFNGSTHDDRNRSGNSGSRGTHSSCSSSSMNQTYEPVCQSSKHHHHHNDHPHLNTNGDDSIMKDAYENEEPQDHIHIININRFFDLDPPVGHFVNLNQSRTQFIPNLVPSIPSHQKNHLHLKHCNNPPNHTFKKAVRRPPPSIPSALSRHSYDFHRPEIAAIIKPGTAPLLSKVNRLGSHFRPSTWHLLEKD